MLDYRGRYQEFYFENIFTVEGVQLTLSIDVPDDAPEIHSWGLMIERFYFDYDYSEMATAGTYYDYRSGVTFEVEFRQNLYGTI